MGTDLWRLNGKMFYSPLRHLFIPVFLNCWLAKGALENMFVSTISFESITSLEWFLLIWLALERFAPSHAAFPVGPIAAADGSLSYVALPRFH